MVLLILRRRFATRFWPKVFVFNFAISEQYFRFFIWSTRTTVSILYSKDREHFQDTEFKWLFSLKYTGNQWRCLIFSAKFREKDRQHYKQNSRCCKDSPLRYGKMTLWHIKIQSCLDQRAVTCAEIAFKFLSRENNLRRLIGRSEPWNFPGALRMVRKNERLWFMIIFCSNGVKLRQCWFYHLWKNRHALNVPRAPTKLCLWQAPSSKLWTGETDIEIGHLNLTLYTLNFASPDPSI